MVFCEVHLQRESLALLSANGLGLISACIAGVRCKLPLRTFKDPRE
jgi:hypothetical protein